METAGEPGGQTVVLFLFSFTVLPRGAELAPLASLESLPDKDARLKQQAAEME